MRMGAVIFGLVAVLAGSMASATAQEAVRVRGGQHDGFGRMVFDWSEPVQHRAFVKNGRLHLEFGRQASFMTDGVSPALDDFVGAAAPGPHGYRITFPLKGQYGLKDFTYGAKVVIDLIGGDSEDEGSPLPQVPVRAGRHDTYDRLVFDWPKTVDYTIEEPDGGQAAIAFESPAQLELDDYRETPLDRVAALTPLPQESGVTASLEIPPGASIRHFRLDNRVVVDVFDPDQTPPRIASADSQTVGGDPEGSETASKESETASKETESENASAPSEAPAESSDTAKSPEAGPAQDSSPSAPAQDPSAPAQESPTDPGAPTPLVPNAAEEREADAGNAPRTDASSTRRADGGSASQPSAGPSSPASAGFSVAALGRDDSVDASLRFLPEQIAAGLAPEPGEIPDTRAPARIPLPWAGDAAAVFRRANTLLLIAEGAPPTSFPQQVLDAAEDVSEVSQDLIGDSAVVRIETGPGLNATLARERGQWLLSLVPRVTLPLRPYRPRVEGGKVIIPTEAPGEVVAMEDPGSGGALTVVPVAETGRGIAVKQRFQEFMLLATTQGVAVTPLSDNVRVTTGEAGIIIRGVNQPLLVSKTDLNRSADGGGVQVPDGNRLLKLKEWRHEGKPFDEARQSLQQAVGNAPANKKHLARLDLGRFYFAHGLATEALGALDLYIDERPRRERDPQVQLMKGASQLLRGDWRPAAATLAHPGLDGVAEALPWRAAQSILAGNDEAGLAAFERSRNLLAPYPDSVRKKVHLWMAGAYLRMGNVPKAATELKKVRDLDSTRDEEARADFLQARIHLLNEETDKAEALWREVAKSDSAAARVRARFVLIERDLAAQAIDREEAIERLERLRFAWRGDAFEAVLLHRLADLYVAREDYRKALSTLREAASNMSGSARAELAAQRMRDIFERLFLEGEADKMSSIEALAVYESFRELTPAGEKGNRMIANLADRLVQVDLLGRAAKLLDAQVRHRLDGVEKAETGARLASIRLLDRAPEEALDALNISEANGMPAELRRQRRHLRARALTRAERYAEAIAVIAGDGSDEGRRIQAKIHIEQGDWGRAAQTLSGMLPAAPTNGTELSQEDQETVIRYAVAATLAGDRAAAERLRSQYGGHMADEETAKTFRMLTASNSEGLSDVGSQLAQVQQAESFVDGFLNSLRQQATLDE